MKQNKENEVAARMFNQWLWQTNSYGIPKGRIWVAWRPENYLVEVVRNNAQLIHCKVCNLTSQKQFFLTFVYGYNCQNLIGQLWDDLVNIAQNMDEAWGIMEDFNSVLHLNKRLGGNDIEERDIRDFVRCLQ